MKNNVITLMFCNTCHKRIKKNDEFTRWENSIYCEDCFEDYLEMVTPAELFKDNGFSQNKEPLR